MHNVVRDTFLVHPSMDERVDRGGGGGGAGGG